MKKKQKKVVLKEAGDVAMGPSFDFYNREVFGGVLDKKVEVSWASFDVLGAYHDTAGVTWPRHTNSKCPIRIQLNRNLIGNKVMKGKENILVHEMILAYLIQMKEEDDALVVGIRGVREFFPSRKYLFHGSFSRSSLLWREFLAVFLAILVVCWFARSF